MAPGIALQSSFRDCQQLGRGATDLECWLLLPVESGIYHHEESAAVEDFNVSRLATDRHHIDVQV